ncbi:type II toxin-antitoxin system RelE/ParE family toxin [Rahnella laticis]|uniref:type II toxin-antitoxin system RelE/ParE family toxin n=1 Tax=Rahnella laticis TaxID=2787622 RepID=UPI0018A2AB46|nr:type II toxin-antitoxin system RelE/ParE family toxin [Rahnella laticis]MBF7993809.1 type II toxin-antitoxin system RelE/ParE family toxin [Rahnella laticis]
MYDVTIINSAEKELTKLPATLYAAMLGAVDELGIYGPALQDPEVRYVGKGLRELRVTSLDGLGRAFYFFMKGQRIYIVHILHKKTAKTPHQDLELSIQRMKTIKRNEHER